MRVGVVNFCSTRSDMLRFSTNMLFENAGTNDFDYYVLTWLATSDVVRVLKESPHPAIRVIHETVSGLEYVPQIRALMNHGFDVAFRHHEWACIVNTDMAFGRGWLANLVRRAQDPDLIPNSVHITPVDAVHKPAQDLALYKANFGIPTEATFNMAGFWSMHDAIYRDHVTADHETLGGWGTCATFPYLLHRKWWERYGPWQTNYHGGDSPDRAFFRRCAGGGARFLLCHDSIVYHHEAVERRGARPPGAEGMPEGA